MTTSNPLKHTYLVEKKWNDLLQEEEIVYSIPKVPETDIRCRAKRIKPVIRTGEYQFYIKEVDLFTQAFTWHPSLRFRAKGLAPLAKIHTIHSYGYYGFFKPSIAEVLAQIPFEYLDDTVAFEVHGPHTVYDLNEQKDIVDGGFHLAVTTLYSQDKIDLLYKVKDLLF